ncbi:MAG TPA: PIG-L family deacetylase [Bacteroidales bacterium]|nr:PIG-L family deacetylase [Bacteroidales bacterium]
MKKFVLFIFVFYGVSICCIAQEGKLNVLVIGAHPDDCDHIAGGVAILYSKLGCKVKFISMTNGDAGHQSMGGGVLAKRRVLEAQEAGKRFGVEYLIIDNHDGELFSTLENRLKIIREMRNWKADIIITHPPDDYHPDHRYTSIIVQDASYMVIVPNVAPDTPPLKHNPVFLYPGFSSPEIAVDIDEVFNQKIYAMSAHESQFFEWLPWTEGILDQVPSGKEEKLKFLAKRWYQPVSELEKSCLNKWYGEPRSNKVIYAETYRYTPYSKHPSDEETRKLFPMIK